MAQSLRRVWAGFAKQMIGRLGADGTLPELNWMEFEDAQRAALRPWLEKVAEQGVRAGARELGLSAKAAPRLTIAVDLHRVNRAAQEWAEGYTDELLRDLTVTTRRRIQDTLSAWIDEGAALPVLQKRMRAIIDDRRRADLIAVTETTRAYAEGNTRAWSAAGVMKREWRTAVDELVCPMCGGLSGKRAEIGQAFTVMVKGAMVNVANPPAHPGCRCWLVPVVREDVADEDAEEIGVGAPLVGSAGMDVRVEQTIGDQTVWLDARAIEGLDTRLLVQSDLDGQVWTAERLADVFRQEMGKLPVWLRNIVPEVRLTGVRDTNLENRVAIARGFEVDAVRNRVTASTNSRTRAITIFQNADLVADLDWQGELMDLREEIGHAIALRRWGSPMPDLRWQQVMEMEGVFAAIGSDAAEDWAHVVALWLTDPALLTRYPARAELLRRFGLTARRG